MEIKEFLKNMALVSGSTYAFVAYIILFIGWLVIVWIRMQPIRKATAILKLYSGDKERNVALKTLLPYQPPAGLPNNEIIQWTKIQARLRTKNLFLLGFVATLITVIVLTSIATFHTQEDSKRVKLIQVTSKRL